MIDRESSLPSPSLFQACSHQTAPFRTDGVGSDIFVHELAERASQSRPAKGPSSGQLLLQFQHNQKRISQVCRRLTAQASARRYSPPASEWLLDNQYILEQAAAEIRTNLPRSFYRELPAVQEGPFRTYPRVYELALFFCTYSDAMMTEALLREAVDHYQQHAPLTIGELWALPIMLRLVLLENLRRLADGIMAQIDDHEEAGKAMESALAGQLPSLRTNPSDAYSLALAEALRENDLRQGPINDHVERWAHLHLTNLAEIQRREFCREAADQVSIGNAVTSLRLLQVIDWTVFFESMSLVEKTLREDPIYPQQDFATRNRCRDTVERLARGSRQSETEIAQAAVARAKRQKDGSFLGNVSYLLLGPGLDTFEQEVKYRPLWKHAIRFWLLKHPNLVYFGLLIFFISAGMFVIASCCEWPFGGWCIALFLLSLFPVSEIAISLINYLLAQLIPPRMLPRLEFKEGVPQEYATFLVIPTLVGKGHTAADLIERLEQHYLVNPHMPMWFGLLTDFADATAEHTQRDDKDIKALVAGVERLNRQYASAAEPRFFLFHRKRQFNPAQGCWMGWERKRGKLIEFNRLMRGARDTSFEVVYPPLFHPSAQATKDRPDITTPIAFCPIRFVLTLDVDTVLPRDAARQMIATLAHPLNRAQLANDGRAAVRGYSVLQPRVSFLYRMGLRSRFARIFTRSQGIDPYSTAASDTYMDLFGRGTFTGKGLYDLGAFSASVEHFPENHVLSHDLIESNFARCALVSDVEVFDEFPARYQTYAQREHRWIRGDWQLLPWLGRKVRVAKSLDQSNAPPKPARQTEKYVSSQVAYLHNPLGLLERWKIFDNLRRSVQPLAIIAILILSWSILDIPWGWTFLALTPIFLPPLFFVVDWFLSSIRRRSLRGFLSPDRFEFLCTAGQSVLQTALLIDQTRISADAIGRTLYRLIWSRQLLLQWETAASAEKKYQGSLRQSFRVMIASVVIAMALALLLYWIHPQNLLVAGPLLFLWASSPLLAYFVSLPLVIKDKPLTPVEESVFRLVARKTWFFFESFVDDQNHWLPPDNYQEEPLGVVAQRTSPTNIGVYLLSTLAARDLGYITSAQLIERLTKTFETLEKLPRHEGHFFNWYDTATLVPLHPAYISTVDSGNLLGCLLALKHGLLEYAGAAESEPRTEKSNEALTFRATYGELHAGVFDTVAVLRQEIAAHGSDAPRSVSKTMESLNDVVASSHADVNVLKQLTASLSEQLRTWSSASKNGSEKWAYQLMQMVDAQAEEETSSLGPLTNGRSKCSHAESFRQLAARADRLSSEMNFKFLYNPQRELFAIGFNADVGKLDSVHYDLLASEACLISYLAVARGEVPRKHWFQLGRMVTRLQGETGLISWGGTMFEYLMPRLFLNCPPGVLLDQAQRTAVRRQMNYGRETKLPWGVSESAYYAFDAAQFYQYQSFGVPGLGFKRGLGREQVIAPYATLLAVDIAPQQVLANLRRLSKEGGSGVYGYYEAIDYTRERLPNGEKRAVVRCYMAHHQGMSLLALTNRLLDKPIPRRLFAEPTVRSTELLLEERVPDASLATQSAQGTRSPVGKESGRLTMAPSRRRIATADTPVPRTHLLSGGRYSVMVTNAGTGFSRWNAAPASGGAGVIDVLRWRSDATADHLGQFFYIRDRRSGGAWCAGHEPLGRHADEYEVIFALDKADFRRVDEELETLTEITVGPDADVEFRRVTLTNLGNSTRYLEITSYSEVVLASPQADLAHPAFGKLFLETEWLPGSAALLCHRRRRASGEPEFWAFHVLADDLTESHLWSSHANGEKSISFETDRARFLGRRNTPSDPTALETSSHALTGTAGAVLDPIFAIRRYVRIPAGERVVLAFTTGIAESRDAALALADRYHSLFAVNRGFELAFAHSRIELQHANLRPDEVHLFQRLAGHLFYPVSPLRAPSETIASNQLGQSDLWRHGVSGDLPIAILRLNGPEGLWHLKQLLRAHEYWRRKNLAVDFVVLCEGGGGYFDQAFTEAINDVRSAGLGDWLDKPGGIFVRKASQMPPADRLLLLSAARLIIDDRAGTLATQSSAVAKPQQRPRIKRPVDEEATRKGKGKRRKREKEQPTSETSSRRMNLQGRAAGNLVVRQSSDDETSNRFGTGFGGFSQDRKDFVIDPNAAAQISPAPWSNVIANPSAGFVITESGSGYTWVGNSQLNRLTPWSNDPVSDPTGEVIYIQDRAADLLWCPTPLPIKNDSPVRVTHGQGYTSFQREINGIRHDLTVGVPPADPLKISILKLKNLDNRERQLSLTYYLEWVLGTHRTATAQHIVTSVDSVTGKAIFARNPFNPDFPRAAAFAATSLENITFTANRGEFIGRNRSLAAPACFEYQGLSGQVGAGLDPCAALQGTITLKAGEQRSIVFLLGETESEDAARALINRYLEPNTARSALQQTTDQWEQMVSTVQVETQDPAFNIMLNRWLVYQILSCRFWGRSAFYQSSGAFGFRDQLQDVMALVYSRPDLARAHLLRAACRQFVEGDVQHWWHVPSGNGVRTRFSDDFLWLPFAVCHYVKVTGDNAVLNELVPYLQADPLPPDKHEVYGPAIVSEAQGSLYDHCVRALHYGWKLGPHGLPLMGGGDWNDGMNRVGIGGKGESVWVAWFQIVCLSDFISLAEKHNDEALVNECKSRITHLREATDHHAWDGRWYRRAYFDDSTPLGSITNQECQIDSIAQSWAVIAEGAMKAEKRRNGDKANLDQSLAETCQVSPDACHKLNQAMDEVLNRLCRPDQRLMLLFDPPFDTAPLDPGYIKGYLPGIRENGGQYTHAACWVVQALILLGRANDAYRIYEMINPIRTATTDADIARYCVEPYVVAGDVYHHPQQIGRGGWTWYTGAAGWYYRVGLEHILGFALRGDKLFLNPVIPSHWPGFKMRFRYSQKTTYAIEVQRRSDGKTELMLDGKLQTEPFIPLVDDGQTHHVTLSFR
jgi:cyclic beta-1,2-glucan synthetase